MAVNRTIRKKSIGTGKNGPLVTVLISTYNRPAYVAEALESILCQSYPNFEIILVRDGGCPMRDVVSRFSDSRLHFIDRDQNRGLPYSFNEALTRAKGEYICYLGDDDKFYPRHIEILLKAIIQNPDYGAVYGDLYKAHCRVLPDGRRRVLAKNVEISRDFDRMLMLQFNHALHVSLLHRKDIFKQAGYYNENLNVLIDWDLTRKLCFYTDFLHVPIVTGEYYAPVGDCDRISVQRRKNVSDYMRNVLTIRTTRPPQPWPKIQDMAILTLIERFDATAEDLLRNIWSHCFYPYQIYVAMTEQEQANFSTVVPNVIPVTVMPEDPVYIRLIKMLRYVNAPLSAILPAGITIPASESMYVERSLYPLMCSGDKTVAYEIVESDPLHWGVVLFTETLRRAKLHQGVALADALGACGVEIRKVEFKDYPFQFDNTLSAAELCQVEEKWSQAAAIYDYLAAHYGNTLWMKNCQANALYHAKRYTEAIKIAMEVNQARPVISSLIIEARSRKKTGDVKAAINLYRSARAILEGQPQEYCPAMIEDLIPNKIPVNLNSEQPEETCVWT